MNKPPYTPFSHPKIHWKETFRKLSRAVDAYDQDKPRGERIRFCWPTIEKLFELFIREYEKGKTKGCSFCEAVNYIALPLKKTPRTISRHLERLMGTPVLKAKHWDMELFDRRTVQTACTRFHLPEELIHFIVPTPLGCNAFVPAGLFSQLDLSTKELETTVENHFLSFLKRFEKAPE